MLMIATELHNRSSPLFHYGNVKQKRPAIRATLAANLLALKDRRGWTQTEVAIKAKISQRYVSSALNQQQSLSAEIVDALASAFGLPGWILLIPDLPVEVLDTQRIPLLVSHYIHAGQTGQKAIDGYAEREANNHALQQQILPFSKPKSV